MLGLLRQRSHFVARSFPCRLIAGDFLDPLGLCPAQVPAAPYDLSPQRVRERQIETERERDQGRRKRGREFRPPAHGLLILAPGM